MLAQTLPPTTRLICTSILCADPESFVRAVPVFFLGGGGGVNVVFLVVDEGRKDPNITKSGPSSARQRNAI